MKVGEIYRITDHINSNTTCTMLGLVLKVMDDGRFYVKSLTNDYPEIYRSRLGSWTRYGVKEKDGLFIDPKRTHLKWKRECFQSIDISIVNYETTGSKFVCKSIEQTDNLSQRFYQPEYSEVKSKIKVVKVFLPIYSNFTYVLLEDKNVGAFADGTNERSVNLAISRANCIYYEQYCNR